MGTLSILTTLVNSPTEKNIYEKRILSESIDIHHTSSRGARFKAKPKVMVFGHLKGIARSAMHDF